MGLITISRLQKALSWADIRESREDAGYKSPEGTTIYIREFLVKPPGEGQASISFIFSDDLSSFGPLLIGPAHWDPYHPETETGKVRSAITKARRFMIHKTHVQEFLNVTGESIGAGLFRTNDIPKTLEKEISHIRLWAWAEAPHVVPVDHSRYVEQEHIYVERRYNAKVERARRKYKNYKDA